jgi:HSP20 family molecular chaperone IbpA
MNGTVTTQENKTTGREQRPEQRNRWLQPQVNIVETKEGFVLEAEMPGVNKEGLEVLLEGSELTIVGRRQQFDGANPVYRETYDFDYRRSFELDPMIDAGRISARMENGVLFLELPKAERVKPRKITVE